MKVFISWSGAKSLAVAEVLREELPCLINELEIFVSSEDIEKGSAWFPKIATELDKSNFGIICVTRENLQSRWLHFEAGVLAGKFSQTKVAPLLIEFQKNVQIPPPLSELQLTKFAKDDFFKLLCALNKNTSKPVPDSVLTKSFDRSWEHIAKKVAEKLKELPLPASALTVKRSQEEILEEILDIVRSLRSPETLPGLADEIRRRAFADNLTAFANVGNSLIGQPVLSQEVRPTIASLAGLSGITPPMKKL
jgi:hypothetical protein